MPETYYDILGIAPSASAGEVRMAYRRQAQRWHPDRTGGAHQRFVLLQQAYAVLSDARQRREYDATLRAPPPPPEPQAPVPPSPVQLISVGEPLHLLARVRIHDLFQSAPMRLKGWVGHVCPRCQGCGCRRCGFAGQTLRERVWEVVRPARWRPTDLLRLPRSGHSGPFSPLPGDVFIEANPLPSHGWRWDRPRQRLEKDQRVTEALLKTGGKISLRAPWGEHIQITVPPSPGRSLWLRVLGLGLGPVSSPDPAWVYLHVGLRFSWPYRRLPAL